MAVGVLVAVGGVPVGVWVMVGVTVGVKVGVGEGQTPAVSVNRSWRPAPRLAVLQVYWVNRLPTPVKISASPRFSSIGCRLTSMAPWQSPTAIACDCGGKQK